MSNSAAAATAVTMDACMLSLAMIRDALRKATVTCDSDETEGDLILRLDGLFNDIGGHTSQLETFLTMLGGKKMVMNPESDYEGDSEDESGAGQ